MGRTGYWNMEQLRNSARTIAREGHWCQQTVGWEFAWLVIFSFALSLKKVSILQLANIFFSWSETKQTILNLSSLAAGRETLYLIDGPVRVLKSFLFRPPEIPCEFLVSMEKKSWVCFPRLWRISKLSLCKTAELACTPGYFQKNKTIMNRNHLRRAGDFRILIHIVLLVQD